MEGEIIKATPQASNEVLEALNLIQNGIYISNDAIANVGWSFFGIGILITISTCWYFSCK